jgi:hypothetical protein
VIESHSDGRELGVLLTSGGRNGASSPKTVSSTPYGGRWMTWCESRTHAAPVRRLPAKTSAMPAIVATTPTIGLNTSVWGF